MKDLYIAKTFAGLEGVLAQELRDLQINEVEILNRAVSFKGDLRDLYTANYWCRTAIRILKPIADFPAADEMALYKGIRSIDWTEIIGLDDTFAIDATLSNSKINHSQYAALKTKDAIADQFVFKFDKRPNVETERPSYRISIFIQNDHCTVALDSSNISLHKRGYRVSAGSAPLNEVLAAGMILLSGWDKKSNFVDPMCGSGTLLIEAALIAMNIPPASYRDFFGFLNWNDFDAELWKEIKIDALAKHEDIDFSIVGSDLAAGMISVAQKNIQSAHLHKDITIEQLAIQDFIPPQGGGTMICNPPYGERIKTRDIIELYREMGDAMKRNFGGYTSWIISSDVIALKQIGLYPSSKIELFNGPLECRFEKFEIYEGSKKEKYLKHDKTDKPTSGHKSTGPSYRNKENWDKEGKTTKFKGRTKTEWEQDSRSKEKNRDSWKENRKENNEKSENRPYSERKNEKSDFSKDRTPRKEFERKSKTYRENRSETGKRGDRPTYSKDRSPRKDFDKKDKEFRGNRSDSERSEKPAFSRDKYPKREFDKKEKDYRNNRDETEKRSERKHFSKDKPPRKEFDRNSRDERNYSEDSSGMSKPKRRPANSRENNKDSKKSVEKTKFYPKGRPPRKRIPKNPDNA